MRRVTPYREAVEQGNQKTLSWEYERDWEERLIENGVNLHITFLAIGRLASDDHGRE